jgi:hypothetical protein
VRAILSASKSYCGSVLYLPLSSRQTAAQAPQQRAAGRFLPVESRYERARAACTAWAVSSGTVKTF